MNSVFLSLLRANSAPAVSLMALFQLLHTRVSVGTIRFMAQALTSLINAVHKKYTKI